MQCLKRPCRSLQSAENHAGGSPGESNRPTEGWRWLSSLAPRQTRPGADYLTGTIAPPPPPPPPPFLVGQFDMLTKLFEGA